MATFAIDGEKEGKRTLKRGTNHLTSTALILLAFGVFLRQAALSQKQNEAQRKKKIPPLTSRKISPCIDYALSSTIPHKGVSCMRGLQVR